MKLLLLIAAMVFAASAQQRSFHFYPVNTKDLDTGEVTSGLGFYFQGFREGEVNFHARIQTEDGKTKEAIFRTEIGQETSVLFRIDPKLMNQLSGHMERLLVLRIENNDGNCLIRQPKPGRRYKG